MIIKHTYLPIGSHLVGEYLVVVSRERDWSGQLLEGSWPRIVYGGVFLQPYVAQGSKGMKLTARVYEFKNRITRCFFECNIEKNVTIKNVPFATGGSQHTFYEFSFWCSF